MPVFAWILIIAAGLVVLDRLLLRAEARGWINYRRVGLNRGAATYHMLELSAIFDPKMQEIVEVKYADEITQDESGDPPVPEPEDDAIDPAGSAV